MTDLLDLANLKRAIMLANDPEGKVNKSELKLVLSKGISKDMLDMMKLEIKNAEKGSIIIDRVYQMDNVKSLETMINRLVQVYAGTITEAYDKLKQREQRV